MGERSAEMPRHFKHAYPPGSVGPGRQVPEQSPRQRAEETACAIRDLITEADEQLAMAALRRALTAKTTIRAPKKPGSESKNDYLLVDDTLAQLSAVRLLFEFRFVKPATVLSLPATHDDHEPPPTQEEMVERLRASGTDINAIIATWVGAAKKVAESGPLPDDVAKTVETVESLAIIDV